MTPQTISQLPQAPVTVELAPLLRRLAAIPSGSYRILSCYLRLAPRDRTGNAYRAEFRSRRHELEQDPIWTTLDHDQRSAVERDLSRITAYLDHPQGLPHARGVAIFACEALHLFEATPLFRLHRTRLILDDTPWIAELAAAERESEPILTVVIDRAHARFFEVGFAEATELSGLVEPSTRGGKYHSDRRDSPGWGERDYHRRLEEERHRHYAQVVTHLEELLRRGACRGVVLAGPSALTSGLARFVPERLARRIMGTIKLNPTAVSAAEVQAAVLDMAEKHDLASLKQELSDLQDAYGSGWATDGPRETLRALNRGQARTLYIRENLAGAGYRCSITGRLVLSRNECRDEGDPLPVRDIVDEAIEEAISQRIQVRFVPDMPEADAIDGMAATLRFR